MNGLIWFKYKAECTATLTCMRPLVDLEVLAPGEDLAATRVRAGERFLAGVDADVVDQLVLGLERASVARAAHPEAGVGGALGSAHVLHGQVGDDLVHRVEYLVAGLPAARGHQARLVGVYPEALHLLLNAGGGRGRLMAHVAQEGPCSGRVHRGHGVVGRVVHDRVVHCRRREVAVVVVRVAGGVGIRHAHSHLMVVMVAVEGVLSEPGAQLRGLSGKAGEEHGIRCGGGLSGGSCHTVLGLPPAQQKVPGGIAVKVPISGVLIGCSSGRRGFLILLLLLLLLLRHKR